ncbi:aBC-type transport system permease component [Coprobacillus sp. CAG:698]|nr:aBC-type transport system permease component [Coprobacillus sp. CAG:698]
MVKTYFKIVRRMFRKQLTRLLSLIGVILISVGFVSGIGSPTDMIKDSIENYYKNQNVSDFIIKSKGGSFSEEEINKIKSHFGEKNVETGTSLDIRTSEKKSLRLYFVDFEKWNINVPELVNGEKINIGDKNQVYAEVKDNKIKGYNIGEKVEVNLKEALDLHFECKINVTVKGIVMSPLTFGKDGEPSYNNPEDTKTPENIVEINKLDLLENIIYCPKEVCPFLPVGDIYVKIENRNLFNSFSKNYEKYIEEQKEEITSLLGENIKIITLDDNYSFKSIISSADKVRGIGNILMIIFLAVTLLVVLSSMMRLMDEERSQIACLKTLGFSSFTIVMKYIFFALVALAVGGAIGFFVGYGVSWLICNIFNYGHVMPPIDVIVNPGYFFLSVGIIIIVTLLATFSLGMKLANNEPAILLRPKVPKSGKRILLEKMPFIWNHLEFKYKSSFRNVLRYKTRFMMMFISIAVSTGLVFAGLALLDICIFSDFGSPSIIGIAIVVVIFAGLLTMVVINTLTTINISERNREIATLMVLGYYDGEICGYIYREIYISAFLGILLGYPTGIGLATLVFKTMEFGEVKDVSWFMWLIVPVVVFGFTLLVTLILSPKIIKTNMNESLKAIE